MNREQNEMKQLADMRENYQRGTLDIEHVDADPIVQFRAWFDYAKTTDILEPNAMTISTIDKEGFPSSRILLLKEIDDDGFIFYTNYDSHKGQEIAAHPKVALNFLWKALEQQVRIVGTVEKISRERTTKYFHSRPKKSQIGAWVSHQSESIADRALLEVREKELTAQYADVSQLDPPPHWGGYKVFPKYIEFWQGRPSRLHDRLRYVKNGDQWDIIRLQP